MVRGHIETFGADRRFILAATAFKRSTIKASAPFCGASTRKSSRK
jgi:hypothetical protein